MKMQKMFKKVVVSGLALSMIAGGGTAAFADGKGKGHGKDWEDKWEKKSEKNIGKDHINLNIRISFDDVKGSDVEWAMKNIARLASKRVFEGYEDGSFQPRKEISRIEAITAAVRLMGLRDQAESQAEMSTQLNFRDAEKIAQKYPWAVGYVAVAAENDLFMETDEAVQPEKSADRLWATILLVKALKLDAEAKAKINTKLPFRDAGKIPAGAVGYVAVALEKGLINGYEDNTFRPNKPVTRAELAALLDRTGTQMPDYNNQTNAGTISVINGSVITMVSGGQNVQLTLHPNALIFRNGTIANVASLVVGDQIRVNFYNNQVIFLEVTQSAQQNTNFTVNGKFNSMTLNSNGEISTVSVTQDVYNGTQTSIYNVASDVTIVGNAALLIPNQNVQVSGQNQIVNRIEIK